VPAEPTSDQQRVMDQAAAGPRGRIPAPMRAWIANPELAQRASQLGEVVRYRSSLPARFRELAILVVARTWTSHFEWAAHKAEALKAGLDPAIVEAIAARRDPAFADDGEAVVYRFAGMVLTEHRVGDDLYRSIVAMLGETAVVELVGTIGYYGLVSMTNNVFEIDLPAGTEPELR
jgi:4-carboxymuconolactone decarboxylase